LWFAFSYCVLNIRNNLFYCEEENLTTKVTKVSIKISIDKYNQKEHIRMSKNSKHISLRIYPFVFF